MGKNTYPGDKKPWETPTITEVNVKKIREEEEMENYLRLISNEELFKLLDNSGPT